MANDQELVIRISAKNLTSGEFAKAREEIAGLTGSAQKGSEAAKLSTEQLKESFLSAFESPAGALKNLVSGIGTDLVASLGAGAIAAVGVAGAVAGVVFGLFELTKSATEVGATLNDMSETTSIAVPRLSGLKFASEATGGSLQATSNVIFIMQRRLQEAPDKFEEGLRKIQLTLRDIEKLSPDEQFLRIAKAFRENTDATNRAGVAMDLFSRQGRDAIPLLMKDLTGLVERSKELGLTWTDEEAAAAEQLEIKMNELTIRFKSLWTHIGREFIPIVISLVDWMSKIVSVGAQVVGWATGVTPAWRILTGVWQTSAAALGVLTGQMAKLPELENLEKQARRGITDAYKLQEREGRALRIGQAEEQTFIQEINKQLADQKQKREEAARAAKKQADDEKKALDERIKGMRDFAKETDEAARAIAASFGGQDVLKNLGVQLGSIQLGGAKSIGGLVGQLVGSKGGRQFEVPGLLDGFRSLFSRDVPNTILAALTGGGNPVAAVASQVGLTFSQNFVGKFSERVTSTLGQTLGGALNAALPGIGALAGPLLGKLGGFFKGLFGGEGKKVNDLRDAFIESAGGLSVLNQKAHEAGVTLDKLLAANKVKDFDAAVTELRGKMGDFAAGQLKDQQDLEAAVQRYGFSLEELGPKLQRQKLSEMAQQILNDFRLLAGAGIDIGTVTDKMSGSINQYVQLALKTGQEVPAAMRPIIEKMIEMGELTDENGSKVTDLKGSGITFAETMTQGFDKVVKKLDELLIGLGVRIPEAINNIPRDINIDVGFNINRPDIPSFASEAFVRQPTLAMVGDVAGGEFILRPSTLQRLLGQNRSTGDGNVELTKAVMGMRADIRAQGRTIANAVRDGLLAAQ